MKASRAGSFRFLEARSSCKAAAASALLEVQALKRQQGHQAEEDREGNQDECAPALRGQRPAEGIGKERLVCPLCAPHQCSLMRAAPTQPQQPVQVRSEHQRACTISSSITHEEGVLEAKVALHKGADGHLGGHLQTQTTGSGGNAPLSETRFQCLQRRNSMCQPPRMQATVPAAGHRQLHNIVNPNAQASPSRVAVPSSCPRHPAGWPPCRTASSLGGEGEGGVDAGEIRPRPAAAPGLRTVHRAEHSWQYSGPATPGRNCPTHANPASQTSASSATSISHSLAGSR